MVESQPDKCGLRAKIAYSLKIKKMKKTKLSLQAKGRNLPRLTKLFSNREIRGIRSWKRLAVLSKESIKSYLFSLSYKEKEYTSYIQHLRKKRKMFMEALQHSSGIPGNYFKDLAKKFDNPTFQKHEIGIIDDDDDYPVKEHEPLTTESQNRKQGSTTFNMCGWCKHAKDTTMSGSGWYNINANCGHLSSFGKKIKSERILSRSDKIEEKINFYRDLAFNNPCLLQFLTVEKCEAIIESIDHYIDIKNTGLNRVRKGIRKIQALEAVAKSDKPFLVSDRPCEMYEDMDNPCKYLNVGDSFMVYRGSLLKDDITGGWVEAIVEGSYKYNLKMVEYYILIKYKYMDTHGEAFMHSPATLSHSDFDYLRSIVSHPGFEEDLSVVEKGGTGDEDTVFVDIWLKTMCVVEGVNRVIFLKSLMNPELAKFSKA